MDRGDGMNYWIFYDRNTGEAQGFKTLDEAKTYAQGVIREHCDEGEGFPNGGTLLIAKITYLNVFHATDRALDHPCLQHPERTALCSTCDEYPDCPQTDSWGHFPFDEIGEMTMDEVTE